MFIRGSGSMQLMNKYMNLQIWILNKSSTLGIFNFLYTRLMYDNYIQHYLYL